MELEPDTKPQTTPPTNEPAGTGGYRPPITWLVATFALLIGSLVVIAPTTVEAKTYTSTLKSGQTMRRGDVLKSSNGACRLAFQTDQNLVLYHGSKALWSTGTVRSGADRLVMQTDGNLVLYDGSKAEWNSRTWGRNGAYLAMQNDCNVVIYKSGRAYWNTRTARTTTKVAPKITLYKGSKKSGTSNSYWYDTKLTGYPAYSRATLVCHDSVDRSFYKRTITVNSKGYWRGNLCYSNDGPNHWVTHGSRKSNTVTWNKPAPPPPPAPAPAPAPKLSLSQGGPAPFGSWYRVSASGFTANSSITLVCHDSVDSNFYSKTVKVDTQGKLTLDLCFSADGPNHWVTAGSVRSNTASWSGGGSSGGSAGSGSGDAGGALLNNVIVKQAESRDDPTSWLVVNGLRYWVPDGGVYQCLISQGAAGPRYLDNRELDALPDQSGQHASCGDGSQSKPCQQSFRPSVVVSTSAYSDEARGDRTVIRLDLTWSHAAREGLLACNPNAATEIVYNIDEFLEPELLDVCKLSPSTTHICERRVSLDPIFYEDWFTGGDPNDVRFEFGVDNVSEIVPGRQYTATVDLYGYPKAGARHALKAQRAYRQTNCFSTPQICVYSDKNPLYLASDVVFRQVTYEMFSERRY